VLVKEVTLYDALCGVYVHVDTLDGRTFTVYNVHVVQPGFEKVIPGEGMPIFGEAGKKKHEYELVFNFCVSLCVAIFRLERKPHNSIQSEISQQIDSRAKGQVESSLGSSDWRWRICLRQETTCELLPRTQMLLFR